MAVSGGRLGFVFGARAFFGGRGFLRSPRRQPPHFHHAPPKGRAKRSAPPPVVFPQASTLSPCTIFRARRTPCRAVFCSPLLRTAGRKKARPAGALFLKGRHKFALWNDTIALRLKNRVAPLFPQSARQKHGGEPSGARAPPKGRAKRRARRARRSAAFRARRTPCRTAFCSSLLRPAGRKKARPGGRVFSERSSQICALE